MDEVFYNWIDMTVFEVKIWRIKDVVLQVCIVVTTSKQVISPPCTEHVAKLYKLLAMHSSYDMLTSGVVVGVITF